MGFAVGNERLLAALARVKSYLDYGAFTPIQVAAAAALNGPQECVDEIRAMYKSRRDALVESFERAGFPIPSPPATMFAWAPVPERFRHLDSVAFAKLLIEKADVAVSPGSGFGELGEGYIRIALVENEQRIRQAARSIKKLFSESTERSQPLPRPQKSASQYSSSQWPPSHSVSPDLVRLALACWSCWQRTARISQTSSVVRFASPAFRPGRGRKRGKRSQPEFRGSMIQSRWRVIPRTPCLSN
jgi:hypothetical protein